MYEGLYPPQMISTGSMAEEVEGWRRERMNVGWGEGSGDGGDSQFQLWDGSRQTVWLTDAFTVAWAPFQKFLFFKLINLFILPAQHVKRFKPWETLWRHNMIQSPPLSPPETVNASHRCTSCMSVAPFRRRFRAHYCCCLVTSQQPAIKQIPHTRIIARNEDNLKLAGRHECGRAGCLFICHVEAGVAPSDWNGDTALAVGVLLVLTSSREGIFLSHVC